MSSWPSPAAIKEEWQQYEETERRRISEREKRHGILDDVVRARREREKARRRVRSARAKAAK